MLQVHRAHDRLDGRWTSYGAQEDDVTYDEAMARLRAVEPLPVGERLMRCVDASWKSGDRGRMFNRVTKHIGFPVTSTGRLWEYAMRALNSEEQHAHFVDKWRAKCRPLRIARERAKEMTEVAKDVLEHRLAYLMCEKENARLRDENARLREMGADQALALKDEEIERLCVLRGDDPVVVRERMKKSFDLMMENARLRAEVESLKRTIKSRCSNDPADFEESYRAETVRLRAALDQAETSIKLYSPVIGAFAAKACVARIRAVAEGKVKP